MTPEARAYLRQTLREAEAFYRPRTLKQLLLDSRGTPQDTYPDKVLREQLRDWEAGR